MAKKYYDEMKSKKGGEMVSGGGRAGLPSEVKLKDYPKSQYGLGGYNDSREGIDMLAKNNHSQALKKPGSRGPE